MTLNCVIPINGKQKVVFNNIEKITMSLEDYNGLPEVPMQRNTEARAKTPKVRKMLSGPVLPVHLDVAIVELTQDCFYYGVKYEKGWRAVVNGCTRRYYWINHLYDREPQSQTVPEYVHVTIYKVSDMEEVRKIYNTFDSPDATEIKKEKLYGILCGMFEFHPNCSKLLKGEFLTALNIACHFLNPKSYNQTSVPVDQLPYQVKEYIEEIKVFDEVCKNPKNWDQALVAAAFMALKIYGKNNDRLMDCLDRIDRRAMDTTISKRDGATHISCEWQTHSKFPNKGTNWDKPGGLKETVPFALYWISKFIEDDKQIQIGFNWNETAVKWFDDFNKTNNSLNSIFQIA